MNEVIAVYRGPLKNRYRFIRGAAYHLKTQAFSKARMKMIMVLPHSLTGEVLSGPLYYWNSIDLGNNWIAIELYDEEEEYALEKETERMRRQEENKIIFKFKEEE